MAWVHALRQDIGDRRLHRSLCPIVYYMESMIVQVVALYVV